MRLWSIHPKYLDVKGIVALWRETLLAKNVLEGNTKGYKNHPQLKRFKKYENPISAINQYLYEIYIEAKSKGYNFDKNKCKNLNLKKAIYVTDKQVEYEFEHLKRKLKTRNPEKFNEIKNIKNIEIHSLFKIKKGEIATWEKI